MKFLFSSVFLFFSMTANAEYSTYFENCSDNSTGITSEILDCISSEIEYQDDKLNKKYKKLQEQLTSSEKIKLRDEQRKWIKFRDRKVDEIYKTQGGSMANINGQSLYLELTMKQADKLERLIK